MALDFARLAPDFAVADLDAPVFEPADLEAPVLAAGLRAAGLAAADLVVPLLLEALAEVDGFARVEDLAVLFFAPELPLLRAAVPEDRLDPPLPLEPLDLLLALLPPSSRRTASVAALTMAAPILLALSAASSATSWASLPASRTVLRTFLFAVNAAAAVTRPAASMLRATGFWASSAALSPASRKAFDIAEDPLFFEPAVLPPDFPPLLDPPEDLDFAIAVSSLIITRA